MSIPHSQFSEAGIPHIDEATCKRCGLCVKTCPADALCLAGGQVHVSESSHFGCIACGHCMMVCPEASITVSGRGISPADLLPLPTADARATADALAALMVSRRSIRHFTDRDVELGILDRIVEMAATAPMGIPPWDVGCVVVSGRDRVREVARQIIKGYEKFLRMIRPWVLAIMRPLMRRSTYRQLKSFIRPLAELYVRNWRDGKDMLFYDAPALMVFHHSPYADPADATIACTYAMLAAESLGLGTTIIGGAPPILQRDRALCRQVSVPEGNKPALAMIVGYPAVQFSRTLRRRFASVNTVD